MSRAIFVVALSVGAIALALILRGGCDSAVEPESVRPTVPEVPAVLPVSRQVQLPPGPPSRSHPVMLVVDSSGRPISGATIGNRSIPNRQVYFTDERGEAELVGIASGVDRFRINCKGYLGVDSEIAVSPQEIARVTLVKFAKVIGTVTNVRGEPVQGASVKAEYEAGSDPKTLYYVAPDDHSLVQRAAISAADGRFEITRAIPNRRVVIRASHPEYGSAALPAQMLAPEMTGTSDIELPDATGLRGVAALGSRPGDPVTLRIWHVEPEQHWIDKIKSSSVRAFEPFEFRDIPTGATLVVAQASEARRLVVGASQVVVEQGKMTDVGSLSPTSSVLRVCCELDSAASSRRIQLHVTVLTPPRPIDHLPCTTEVTAEEASDFSIVGLPNGDIVVEATVIDTNTNSPDPLYRRASERVTHNGDTRVSLMIARKKPPTSLVVNLEPPPGVIRETLTSFVWLENDKAVVAGYPRALAGNTRFELLNLPAGEMTLRAVAHGYTLTKTGIVIVPEHTETIAASDWSQGEPCGGTVIDEEGNPVASASVEFTAPTIVSDQLWFLPLVQDVSTDEHGRFSINALPRCKGLQVMARSRNSQSEPHQFGAGSALGVVLQLKKNNK